MIGPEHYHRAEALLEYQQRRAMTDVDDAGRVVEAYDEVDVGPTGQDLHRNPLMAAQVHATLALTAALVNNDARWVQPPEASGGAPT